MIATIAEKQLALNELCRRYKVKRLDLFGSAAVGHFRPGESDLDFLVEFEPLPPGLYADNYFGLIEGMQRLLGQPVDLVVARAIRNPFFRDSIERTKTLIHADREN